MAVSRAVALPPSEAQVQGLYEGNVKDGPDETKLEARVVAQGNGTYKVLIRQMLKDNKIAHVELTGKTTGDTVTITDQRANGWTARYAAGSFKGTFGPGGTAWEVKRVEKKPPTLGQETAAGSHRPAWKARTCRRWFGPTAHEWHLGDMSQQDRPVWEAPLQFVSATEPKTWPSPDQLLPQGWALGKEHRRADVVTGIAEDGSIQIPRRNEFEALVCRQSRSARRVPAPASCPRHTARDAATAVSICQMATEIQVLDSFGEPTYIGGGCGGVYAYEDPDVMDVIESLKGKPECKYTLASAAAPGMADL